MSNLPNKNQNKKGSARWIILFILAVLVVLFLIFLAYFWPSRAEIQKRIELSRQGEPQTPAEVAEVKSYFGAVTMKSESDFVLKSLPAQNNLTADYEFLIQVNSDTKFTRVTFPQTIDQDTKDVSALIKNDAISFNDLKVGDDVIAIAKDNIIGQKQFIAQTVEVIAKPEVKEFIGAISKVGDSTLEVSVTAEDNLYLGEKTFIVNTDNNTKIIQLTLPKNLTPKESLTAQVEKKDISLQDLKVGDKVSIVSNDNVQGKTDFLAAEIDLLPSMNK